MAETRCRHGYLRSRVRCPEGCPLPPSVKLTREGQPRRHRPTEGRHPGFVDLTGQRFGAWVVLSEASTDRGTAQWLARHDCGATSVLLGTRLRSAPPKFCKSCRGRRIGEGRRLSGAPSYSAFGKGGQL